MTTHTHTHTHGSLYRTAASLEHNCGTAHAEGLVVAVELLPRVLCDAVTLPSLQRQDFLVLQSHTPFPLEPQDLLEASKPSVSSLLEQRQP